jgi:CRP-like cAMP-binding protein
LSHPTVELDLDRLREFVPIDSLERQQLKTLASSARVERRPGGHRLFSRGDQDTDAVYLLRGEIELADARGVRNRITAANDQARFALSNLKPRRFDAFVVSSDAEIARIEAPLLEKLIAWEQLAPGTDTGMEVAELDGFCGDDREWMLALLQSPSFLKLPAANLERVFKALEPVRVRAGQQVIRMDDPGDYYYLLREGLCEVSRGQGALKHLLAKLGPGQSFGEDALVSAKPRNADVNMLTDGLLMRLSQKDFHSLLEEPLIKRVDLRHASELITRGGIRLDVRTEDEFRFSGIKSSLNIPLYLLRLKLPKLDRHRTYVVYCDSGERSSAAAFIMSQAGYDAYQLDGGLSALSH